MPKIYLIGIIVFVALGYLTMGEWSNLFIPTDYFLLKIYI